MLLVVGPGIGRADGDLDVLGRPLADQQVELAPTVRDDVLVQLVAADADAARDHDAAEADDRDLRGAAADVHDEAAGGLADGQAGTDGRRHGLLDEPRPAGTGVEGRVADGALLDLRDARRDAQQHPRPGDEADPVVHLLHEVLDHLLGDVEVADDAVPQRPHGDDAGGRAADHPLGLGADLEHLLGAGVDGDHAGLADDDAAAADVDEGVGGPEIDADVPGEPAKECVEHGLGWTPLGDVGRARGPSDHGTGPRSATGSAMMRTGSIPARSGAPVHECSADGHGPSVAARGHRRRAGQRAPAPGDRAGGHA